MKNIMLCPNPKRDKGLEFTKKVYIMLERSKAKPFICLLADGNADDIEPMYRVLDPGEAVKTADLAVCFGGDGTILHTARFIAGNNIPIIGVNLGTKGFNAELEPYNAELILKAVSGECTVENRMMLDVCLIRKGEVIYSDFALNDAVVGGIAKLVDLTVFGDGDRIISFSGDGVVVATPTGSTAYSMSAGGPIVEPSADSIIVTPICAHALVARSFVLASGREVTVEVGRLRGKAAYLSSDGSESVAVDSGDIIKIKKSDIYTQIIHVSDKSFYEKVSEKLGERI